LSQKAAGKPPPFLTYSIIFPFYGRIKAERMHQNRVTMDWNKIIMILKTEDIHASVRIANHHPVTAQMLWERSIPDPQLICILQGTFEYQELNQPKVFLLPGDILFIQPSVQHTLQLSPPIAGGEIAGMHFEFTPSGRWAAGDYRLALQPAQVTRVKDTAYLEGRFKNMAEIYGSYHPYRKELVNALASEILFLLAAYWEDETARAAHPSQRMETILAYIREHLAQPITRQSLAETFNLSPGYVNQIFKVELGMSPSAVINRERAARAYQLIERDGFSVAETAVAVGYQDPFYFSRVFKQIYTIPPSQVASHKFTLIDPRK
jgi:AraC-like DNA-binding protein